MSAPVVIKIGGRALEAPGAAEQLASELGALSQRAIIVHGGGRDVSAWCARLAIAPRFIDGLRVTDQETLEVATAVLAGLANKRLVALLRAAGVDAVGLSALDGGIARIEPHPDAERLGRVGTVREVRPDLLNELIARGSVPVLASIGAWRGELLNLNADELAAALAGAMRARTLVLLSDTPGLVLDGERVERLTMNELESAMRHADVRDGMIAKLDAARRAIERGAARVRIAAWNGPGTLSALLGADSVGTTIVGASPVEVSVD